MHIEIAKRKDYVILRIQEDLSAKSNLAQLKERILGLLRKGQANIALSFTRNSYFHSQTIATLVQCIETVHEQGGTLAIVEPNEDIRDVLNTISLDKLVTIYPTEDAIDEAVSSQD
jgi:anti-anti-sigma factor